ncbi:MAG: ATP-binding cassette domain-containing protein [Spartobacteria bacterium]|nr:ATP-binding cassette domain-containing protein [Spartobacteria bacterium]
MIKQNIPIVELHKISCACDGHEVLSNISLKLYAGKIHAIVGDHGSGKSYICDILSGVIHPCSGELYLNGQISSPLNILKAQKRGIQTIFQDFNLIQNFTVAENLYTPDIHGKPLPFNKKKMQADGTAVLKQYGLSIKAETRYKDLTLSEKILINIIRALIRCPKLLILDETLEKLSAADLKTINELLRKETQRGLSVLCSSHKIDDIYNFAHSVTIIRNGQIFLTDSIDNIDRINLIKLCYAQLSDTSDVTDISREFYQLLKYNEAILQKLPINLIVTDDMNRIKMVNDAGKKYFHIDSQSFRDKDISSLFGKNNEALIHLFCNAFLNGKETVYYNVPLHLNGLKTVINSKTIPIYDGAFLVGNIVILEDISEQEKLREQFHLSEKLASVGLLAAGVAHEINNPLEIIFNHLNYLNMKTPDVELKGVIGEIEEEMRDIRTIVSNLISFSDNNNASYEQFNLNDLIKSMITLIRFNAKHNNIRIEFESQTSEIIVEASKNEIKQVLLNLLKNSFEAMPQGGIIKIQAGILIEDDRTEATVSIQDNGSGIDKQHIGDIFLPFFSTNKSSGSNLGLGLSVIYGIIKKYKGDITVENLETAGCRFDISLPCYIDR